MTTITTDLVPGAATDRSDLDSPPAHREPPRTEPASAPRLSRPMPVLGFQEPPGYRWAWLAVGLMVTALFAVVVFRFYAPADAGVDQNAYLTGGRLIAQHLSLKYVLPNPYAYTGGMFVRMPTGVYYPKYPAGLPLLYACFFWIFGPDKGPIYAFVVSPASAVLSVLGTFFLARAVAGSFAAVMAAILLCTSQVMLSLADNPNSHAACTAVIIWGMYFLVRWWQTGRVWQGVAAGFLIGYAYTIRYTEGLLVLPIAIACLTRIRWGGSLALVQWAAVGMAAGAAYLVISLWSASDWAVVAAQAYAWGHPHHDVGVGGFARLASLVHPAQDWLATVVYSTQHWFGPDRRWQLPAAVTLAGLSVTTIALTARRWASWATVLMATAVGTLGAAFALFVLLWTDGSADGVRHFGYWFGPDGRTGRSLQMFTLYAFATASLCVLGVAAVRGALPGRTVRAFLRNVAPGLAWAVPVALLVIYNSAVMRHPAGYDTTHESELGVAFQWQYFTKNWEMVLRTFDDLELFFVVPFALAGVAVVFRRSWRVGVLLLAWLVPGIALYTSYYWSMNFDVAYARFYLTFLPALCVAAAVAFHDGLLGGRTGGTLVADGAWRWWSPGVQVLAAAAIVGAVLLVHKASDQRDWRAVAVGVDTWTSWVGPGRTGPMLGAVGLCVAALGLVAIAALRSGLTADAVRGLAARVPATVAVGVVVATAASVSTYRALNGLRDGSENLIPLVENYRSRLNLAAVGRRLIDKVPANAVLFSMAGGGIQSPTNYVQFLRDWELFPSDAFSEEGSRRGFGGGGNRNRRTGNNGGRGGFMNFGGNRGGGPGGGGPGGGPGGPPGANTNDTTDQDQPQATPIQPEQQDYHASLYRNVSRRALFHMQGEVVRAAFAAGRPVFAIVDKDALETLEDNLDEDGHYTYKTLAAWSDVALPADREDTTAKTADRNRWGGGGRMAGGRRGGGNAGPGMARLFGLSDTLNDWRLVQVLPETPAAKPAKRGR